MRYRVVHRTRYAYAEPVSSAYGEHHLLPRTTPTQHVLESSVAIDPAPDDRRERTDLYGNRVEHYGLFSEHDELVVTTSSLVDVQAPPAPIVELPWEEARDRIHAGTESSVLEARTFLLDSPQVAAMSALHELAAPVFAPGRGLVEAYRGLVHLLYDEFEFDATATTVTTAVEEVLEARAGVCQDFAHLLIGCLRSLDLPARYVSGYLETLPPPGQPRLQGADASHAWAALYVPGHGWLDGDPTNAQLVGTQHVTVAWGRDYGDVAPLKGVIYTDGATESLDVAVDVLRVEDAPAQRTTVPSDG
jgi:transglutaminase-like putative cysteine protease